MSTYKLTDKDAAILSEIYTVRLETLKAQLTINLRNYNNSTRF